MYNKEAINKLKKEQLKKETFTNESSITSFVKKTYQLMGASMLAGATGSYLGMMILPTIANFFWGFVILEFALLFGLMFAKEKEGLNMILLFAFAFMTGITSVPTIAYTLMMSGGAAIVGNAFLMTAVAFGGLSLFAIKTENDYRSFGKPIFFALLGIIIVSIINMIFFQSNTISLIISGIVVLIMSVMIVVDTQNLVKGGFTNPYIAAVQLYLDFLNMFLSLLNILRSVNR